MTEDVHYWEKRAVMIDKSRQEALQQRDSLRNAVIWYQSLALVGWVVAVLLMFITPV